MVDFEFILGIFRLICVAIDILLFLLSLLIIKESFSTFETFYNFESFPKCRKYEYILDQSIKSIYLQHITEEDTCNEYNNK